MIFFFILLFACVSEVSTKTFNDPPTIVITHGGTSFFDGDNELFVAQVGDSNHSYDDLMVSWFLDDVLQCDWSGVDVIGESKCNIQFSEGATTVMAQVNDPQGGTSQDSMSVSVTGSSPPVIQIIAPIENQLYRSDELILFDAVVFDAEESPNNLAILWNSSLDGDLTVNAIPDSSGRIEGVSLLSEGQHLIRLDVEDSTGKRSSDSVLIDVGAPNSLPECEIIQPIHGSHILVGEDIIFEGLVSDADASSTDLIVEWHSNHNGLLGTSTPSSSGTVLFTYNALSPQTHTISMDVRDQEGGLCSEVTLIHVDSAPNISIIDPIAGSTHNLSESILFSAQVSDTEDVSSNIHVTWSSDVDGVLHSQFANSSGESSFFDGHLAAGPHQIRAQAEDSAGYTTDSQISIYINTPPSPPNLTLYPATPTTTDDLIVSAVGANDIDGDSVTFVYEWFQDGILSSQSSSVLSASDTTKTEEWTVRVTPNDGFVSGMYSEATVTIVNSSPTAPLSVSISPSSPTDSDDLVCTASGSTDADGDSVTYVYEWLGDGISWSGSTISHLDTNQAEDWLCIVHASDGVAHSTTTTSSTVTISSDPISTTCDECVDLGGGVIVGFAEIPAGGLPSGNAFLSNDFFMMTTEVSQSMFETLMSYNDAGHSSCGINCPMENVTWHESAAFANALSIFTGRTSCYSCSYSNISDPSTVTCTDASSYSGQNIYNCPGYRLPTDAEWEYVARSTSYSDIWTINGGGSISYLQETGCQSGVTLSDGTLLSDMAWYCSNSSNQPHDIAQKQINGFGVYDMHGNVYEWCQDWYDVWWTIGVNPVNISGTTKLMRGGSWDAEPYELRSGYREHNYPTQRDIAVGFRLVRTAP